MADPTTVSLSSFVRLETNRMFTTLQGVAGGVNRWHHVRVPTPLDAQNVIRMNRDTLYSISIVDLAAGATVSVPDAGDRYLSVMVVNDTHHVMEVLHGAGEHELSADRVGSRHAAVAVRILVDANDPADVTSVNALQDQLAVTAGSAEPVAAAQYDQAAFDEVRRAVLTLAKHSPSFDGAFGRPDEVDPLLHVLGTAAGWGGLPLSEARYLNVSGGAPGAHRIVVPAHVPVDGFWSISMYNRDGFFEANDLGVYSVNSVTAEREADGTTIVHLGGCGDGRVNCIPLPDGWNYVVRLYRPRPEVLDGSWTFPAPEPI